MRLGANNATQYQRCDSVPTMRLSINNALQYQQHDSAPNALTVNHTDLDKTTSWSSMLYVHEQVPAVAGAISLMNSLSPGAEPVLVPTGGMVKSLPTTNTLLVPSLTVSASSRVP